MKMAKDEGWLEKNGSKWKTMPEVMIRYRAASFFGRLNCPNMIMGIYSTDEVVEIGTDAYREIDPAQQVAQEIKENANAAPIDIEVDEETGEVLEPDREPSETLVEEPDAPGTPDSAPEAPPEPPKDKPRQTLPHEPHPSLRAAISPHSDYD
jgi:hypothetical protein